MGSGRCARVVHNGVQAFFLGEKGRDGAQIDEMQCWGLRDSLSAGKNMHHEENLRPDSISKSKTYALFKK